MNLIKSEDSIIGGRGDDVVHRLEPTILPDVDFDHEIMKEENIRTGASNHRI